MVPTTTKLVSSLHVLANLMDRQLSSPLTDVKVAAWAAYWDADAVGADAAEVRALLARILRDIGETGPEVASGPREMFSPRGYAERLRNHAERLSG